MRKGAVALIATTLLSLGGCLVPKDRFDQQKLETDSCYAALERENQHKRELSSVNAELAKKNETYDALVASLQDEMKQKLIDVKQKGQRVTVNVSDQVLFDSGSAEVKTAGQAALDKIAHVLAKVGDHRIDIEGHTDNLKVSPELAKTFPSNWELSATRATNVVRYLEAHGVNPARMAAVGKSEFRPVASNGTPGGRQLNRRIEIVLTPWDGDR